jgi:5-methylcytosine-specific restriction endonuclease McrA
MPVTAPTTEELRGLYHTSRWMRARRAYLRMHPRCVAAVHVASCSGLATVVDHVIPRSRGGSTWNRANWQSLSKPCHDAKTRREQGWGDTKGDPTGQVPGPRAPSKVVTADYSRREG